MKKTSLTVVFLCALCALTYAGPEQYQSGKEMKNVVPAPTPTPCPSWTGFYVGGSVAYAYGWANTHLDLTGTWEQFPDAERAIQDRGDRSFNESGAELGGLIGYNYQFGHWVVGAEAAGGYMWLRNSFSETFPVNELETDVRVSGSFKTHYLFTFGGKLGYAFCRWLPYFTGGLAVGDTDFDGQILEQNDEGFRFRTGKTNTRTGWFIGGGLEYMVTNHWRLRGQYQYIDLGSTGVTREDSFGLGFESHRSIDLKESNAQFAIIYGF
jgi:outer membrane immunogenic protein